MSTSPTKANEKNDPKGSQGKGDPKGAEKFPTCMNKKQARMVCLQSQCTDYPFFCSHCEDDSCQKKHHHEDKLISIGFKQFVKRVLRDRKPTKKLQQAMQGYQQVLQRLRTDVNEFVDKQIKNLAQVAKKAGQVPPEESQLIKKLKQHKYQGLTGKQMDSLWSSSVQDPNKTQTEDQMADFIKIKEQQVQGISEHFEHLNKMELDDNEEKPAKGSKTSPTKTSVPASKNPPK